MVNEFSIKGLEFLFNFSEIQLCDVYVHMLVCLCARAACIDGGKGEIINSKMANKTGNWI